MTAPAPESDCCRNCRAYEPRQGSTERLEAAGINPDSGRCRRDPTPVMKFGTEWCLSHVRATAAAAPE